MPGAPLLFYPVEQMQAIPCRLPMNGRLCHSLRLRPGQQMNDLLSSFAAHQPEDGFQEALTLLPAAGRTLPYNTFCIMSIT